MANSSFFQDAVERANKKQPTVAERLGRAYSAATERRAAGAAAVDTPVLDSTKGGTDTPAFSPATSLDEFMGILPTPEVKNDGLDGTPYADMVRKEWERLGVDNAYDYGVIARDYSSRSVLSGLLGAARDSVNYISNANQQWRAEQAAEQASMRAMADMLSGNSGMTYEERYNKYRQEAQEYENKPLEKTVDWGEAYDRESERIAQELGVNDEARKDYQFGQALGRMAPSIALSATGNLAGAGLTALGAKEAAQGVYLIGRVLSSASTFTSAAGGAYEDAKAHGIDDDKAMTYATAVGAIELATEAFSSGLGKVGGKKIGTGGVTDDAVEALAKKVASDEAVQEAIIYAGGVLGEGFEEWLSEWGDYFANRMIVGYDERTGREVWEDSKESFRQGAMMSALLNTTRLMKSGLSPKDAIQQGIDQTAQDIAQSAPTGNIETETANAKTDSVSPAASTMADILSQPANRSQANRIINDANLRAEYEAYTGETLPAVKSEAAKAVMEYSRNHAELTPLARTILEQPSTAQETATAQTGISPAAAAMARVLNGQNTAEQNAVSQSETQYSPERIAQAQEAYSRAAEVQTRLDSQMRQIADRLGISYENGVQKSVNSILSRMTRNENRGRGSDPYTLKDLARTHLELNSWDDIPKVLAYLDEMKIPYTTDAKNTQQGYKGFHITWNDNGIGIELQLSTPQAWKVKMETEKIYAKWREAEARGVRSEEKAAYEADLLRSMDLWNQVETPDFPTIANSSGVRSRESGSKGSPSDMAFTSGPQRPLENSSNPLGKEESYLSMRSSGLTNSNSIQAPPNNSAFNIPQNMRDGNSPGAPTRLSQTAQTARDARITPDNVKQSINANIENGGYRYIPESNDAAAASARSALNSKGFDSVLREWTAKVNQGKTGSDLAATGAILYNEAIRSGNTRLALDILSDYQILGTNTAQGLQAMRIIKDLTPEGQLYIMQQDVAKLNENRSESAKQKNPEGYKIDPALADAYLNAKDDAARDAAVTAIQQDIAAQIPASFAEKWRALRYLNMLGNVKTQVRNILGNTGMMAMTGAKNTVRGGIEYLAEKLSGGKYQRTTAFGVGDYMNAAKQYYDTVNDYVNGDSKYMESNLNDSFSRGIQDARQIFGFKPWEAYRKATKWAMEAGDTVFIKPQFARYLSGYLKARGMDANTFTQIVNGDIQATTEQQNLIHSATEYAAREAQEATFHDNNEISKAVSNIGKGWPKTVRALFEGLLPFRKTPANVMVRAEEYSPLGIVNTAVNAYQAAKGQNGKTAADVINSFSKTATGTSLFALGALLAKAGLARGAEDDDEQDAFDKLRGMQDYSIILPDGSSYTIDWLSPAAVPFFMGVAFSDATSDGEISIEDFIKAIYSITDPMIQMSMLQGVNDAFDQIQYSDNNLVNLAVNLGVNYLSQGIGNTLLGQFERITEKNRETTYTDAEDKYGRSFQRTLGKVFNKLPGEYNQVEYVDAWGRTQDNGSLAARAMSNLLSPGYVGKNRSTEVDSELQRLYDAGQTNVFPSRISMTETVTVYNSAGKEVRERRLTADEYVQYQKVMGQTSLEMVKDLMASPLYKGMSDEAKADAISEIYGYAKDMAAMAIEPSEKYARNTDISKLSNPAAYYGAVASFSASTRDSDNRSYASLDSLTSTFNKLPEDVQSAVTEKKPEIGKLLDARENGYDARTYYNVYDSVKALTPAQGYKDVATWQKIIDVCSMNIPDDQKDYFTGNYFQGSMHDKYLTARERGFSPYSVALAYQVFSTVNGVDKNGDGRNDTGTRKAAFIAAMMGYGASKASAEWLYKLFKSNK